MDLFSYEGTEQLRLIEELYKRIALVLKKGIIVAKYREAILINSLVKNYYEIHEADLLSVMSNSGFDETILLSYELDGPLDITKLSVLSTLTEPYLMDSSYLLFKQQVEIGIEHAIYNLCKDYRVSATVNIEDYIDDEEILWDIKINLMAGK